MFTERRRALYEAAEEIGVSILNARSGDASKQGIHLLNPSDDKLSAALETAENDGFDAIYLHTNATWPKGATKKRVLSILEWLLDHGQEDTRVTVGCRDCNESHCIMASTARTAWLPLHWEHKVWICNPFKRR